MEVSEEIWKDFEDVSPQEITERTGVRDQDGIFHLPFLDRILLLDPVRRQVQLAGAPEAEPGFRLCLTALLYLLHLNPAHLGPPISPLNLPGGVTFFRGPHALPHGPLEARFGRDPAGFAAAGRKLGGKAHPAGDAAVALEVFPGLVVELILWLADGEFPAQVSFTFPAHLDRFWLLDAVWGLLNLATREMLDAGFRE